MDLKKLIIGTITTIVIGGSAYTVSQTDIIDNFAKNSGMTQQQAEEYVNNLSNEDLVSFGKVGQGFIDDSALIDKSVRDIDCTNYEYEWESYTLSCEEGKSQLNDISNSEASLGKAYLKLESDSASKDDITATIQLIDNLNSKYNYEIVNKILDQAVITETKQTNSYNKSVLEAAVESD